MPFTKILKQESENVWVLESEDGKRQYLVQKNQENLCSDNDVCRLKCFECGICLHSFTCQCTDYLIQTNICKHIHLLCRQLQRLEEKKITEPEFVTDEVDDIDVNETPNINDDLDVTEGKPHTSIEELETLRQFVSNEANDDSFENLKKRTEKAVLELLGEVQTCNGYDTESLKHTLKQVNAVKNTLASLKKNKLSTSKVIPLKSKVPLNKNIEKQRS